MTAKPEDLIRYLRLWPARECEEGADLIEELQAQNRRLREALAGMVDRFDRAFTRDRHEVEIHYSMCIEEARRALEPKP